jgi:hypothetical protein
MSARQIAKPKISDANPDKMFDMVPDGFKHAANLAVYSLPQYNPQTCGRDGAKSRNFRSLAIEKNSAQQFRRECVVPWPIQSHFIFLVDFMARVREPLRQFAIICEEKQTFSLRVQAPDVEEAGKFLWKQIKDGVARVLIFSGRDKSRRLVQDDGKCRSGSNEFAIDFNVVVRARLCAEVGADFTVYGDATRCDQFITISARSNAGGGEKAIETQGRSYKVEKVTSLKGSPYFNAL